MTSSTTSNTQIEGCASHQSATGVSKPSKMKGTHAVLRSASCSRTRIDAKHYYSLWHRNNNKERDEDLVCVHMSRVVPGRIERDARSDEGEGTERIHMQSSRMSIPLEEMLCGSRDGDNIEFALARHPRKPLSECKETGREGYGPHPWRIVAKVSVPYKKLDSDYKVDDWTDENGQRYVEYDFRTESGVGVSMVAW